jgi:hypothetical protein
MGAAFDRMKGAEDAPEDTTDPYMGEVVFPVSSKQPTFVVTFTHVAIWAK